MGVMPNGPDGMNPDAQFGVSDTGISELPSRTQVNVVAILKAQKFPAGSVWKNPAGVLKQGWSMVMSALSGAATNAVNALTQIGTLIWKVGGSIIDDVGDFINAALANANTAVTNAGHAIAQIGSLIGKVGGSIIDDVGDFINAAVSNASTALANAGISLAGLQNFLDALASAFGGSSSGNTVSTVAAQSIEVAQAAQRAEASAYAAQLAVAALAKDLDSAHDGAVFDMTFTGADGAALNATDWPTTGPTSGDLCIRLIGTIPTMGIKAGAATNSTFYAGCGHIYETDDQSLSVIIAGGNSDTEAATRLHFHCDDIGPAATRGLYLSIVPTGVELGYFTTSGGIRTYTAFGGNGTITTPMSSGMRAEVRNIGNQYQIVLNGAAQPTYVDAANRAVAGDFHAFVTMETKTKTWNPGLPWQTDAIRNSFFLAGVLMSDYAPIAYKGSGAKMYRTSTANIAAASGANILPDNTFGVEAQKTSDITVDLVTGKFTVSRDDWYIVTFQVAMTVKTAGITSQTGMAPYPLSMALFKNGALEKYAGETLRPIAYDVTGTITGGGSTFNGTLQTRSPDAAYASVPVYLQAGDYIQLGYNANAANSTVFTGEATGTKTYFEIMGANP